MWNLTANRDAYPLRPKASAVHGVAGVRECAGRPPVVRAPWSGQTSRRASRSASTSSSKQSTTLPVRVRPWSLGNEVEHGQPAEPARLIEQVPARHRLARKARNALSRAGSRRVRMTWALACSTIGSDLVTESRNSCERDRRPGTSRARAPAARGIPGQTEPALHQDSSRRCEASSRSGARGCRPARGFCSS